MTPLNVVTLILRESQEKKREKKGEENVFEEIIAESFPNLGMERHLDPGGTENSHQNQQKQANTKTCCSYICKIERFKKILKAARQMKSNLQVKTNKVIRKSLHRNLAGQKTVA